MTRYKYFTDDELHCPCGKCDGGKMDDKFMAKLIALRDELAFPFPVTSAYRCEEYNRKVGGVKRSYHLLGRAVDIAVVHEQAYRIIEYAKQYGFRGIGINQKGDHRFIHLDDRTQHDVTLFTY